MLYHIYVLIRLNDRMMNLGQIIDVKGIVEKRKEALKLKIDKLNDRNIVPKLAVILASFDEASKIYVGKKKRLCEEFKILQEEYIYDENVTEDELLNLIDKLNNDDTVDGILIQLPLFKHLDEKKILNYIKPTKDVDGFHPVNLGNLVAGSKGIVSCTPKGIITILEDIGEDIKGKNAVVIGRSVIVGKSIAHLLLNKDATVTICHSKTKNLEYYTKNADILVVAVGIPKFIKSDIIKEGSVVIDVGINRVDGKVVGDVDTEDVLEKVKYVTSVPGGVGITTVLSLIENVADVASLR
ncbi:MAG: bifunctional 5,10-methylenetetrahydrofolate dehydrogenase/5,10-methenyltetrahydrofolate cyclohydrolase [Clostridia bacterium]|nr:bifunctional 5,10-methylenetetrahydrofolate dehydrogenase/5,10-methenyltetrahydrofolate cyclohydrolase [Clostridia bacterium]